jgi:hypothetical protein
MAHPPHGPLLKRFAALCEAAFVDGAADALNALARLAAAAGESPALYTTAPSPSADDATSIQVVPVGIPALPPGWAALHPAAAARLLALGPPLVVEAAADSAPRLVLTPDLAGELERVKNATRRQAHATLGARKRAALADAIAQATATDGTSPLASAWGAAPTDQAAVLSRTLALLAVLAAQPGGLPVAAPLLCAVAVALDTALALSTAAAATAAQAASTTVAAAAGSTTTHQPLCVALLLDDAVLLEVSSSPAVIAAAVGWLACAAGLVPDAHLTSPPQQQATTPTTASAATAAGGAGAMPPDAAVVVAVGGSVPAAVPAPAYEPLRAWRLQPAASDATLSLLALTLLMGAGGGGGGSGDSGTDAGGRHRHHGHGHGAHPPHSAGVTAAASTDVCAHPPRHPRLLRALHRHVPGGGSSVSATVHLNWQCCGGPGGDAAWAAAWLPQATVGDDDVTARHWAHLDALSSRAAAAASSHGGGGSRGIVQHPYLPHVLTHRALLLQQQHAQQGTGGSGSSSGTLPSLLRELRALAATVKAAGGGIDPTALPFLQESDGGAGHKGHRRHHASPPPGHAAFAAPGIVTLTPASDCAVGSAVAAVATSPPGPRLAGAAAVAAPLPSPALQAQVRSNADGRSDTVRLPVPLRDAAAAAAAGGDGAGGGTTGRSGWCPALLGGWW